MNWKEKLLEEGDYTGLDDAVFSGMYPKGSQIRKAVENSSELNEQQKKLLKAVFEQHTFKRLSEYELNNRYGEIISKFYGNKEERQHTLENNIGVVLFNVGLFIYGYFISCFFIIFFI